MKRLCKKVWGWLRSWVVAPTQQELALRRFKSIVKCADISCGPLGDMKGQAIADETRRQMTDTSPMHQAVFGSVAGNQAHCDIHKLHGRLVEDTWMAKRYEQLTGQPSVGGHQRLSHF